MLKFAPWKGKKGKIGLLTTGTRDMEFLCIQPLWTCNISMQGHVGCQSQTHGLGKRQVQTQKHTKVQNIHRRAETLSNIHKHSHLNTNVYIQAPQTLLETQTHPDTEIYTDPQNQPCTHTHKHVLCSHRYARRHLHVQQLTEADTRTSPPFLRPFQNV